MSESLYDGSNETPDSIIAYQLDNQSLSNDIAKGEIMPLSVSKDPIKKEQSYGVVNLSGDLIKLKYEDTVGSGFAKMRIIQSQKICKGYSGLPVLVLDSDGNPTGETIGVLSRSTYWFNSNCTIYDQYIMPFDLKNKKINDQCAIGKQGDQQLSFSIIK